MPLEIRELVIKATLGNGGEEGAQGGGGKDNEQDAEQSMIKNCVEAVLEILQQRNER